MAKIFLGEISHNVNLYRDTETGIACACNLNNGGIISIHPFTVDNKKAKRIKKAWDESNARIMKSQGFLFNIDEVIFDWYTFRNLKEQKYIATNCNCLACLERRKRMNEIYLITLSENGQVETNCTVEQLINAWYTEIDVPTNDDVVVSCVLNGTITLYFETFGELMVALTGDTVKAR